MDITKLNLPKVNVMLAPAQVIKRFIAFAIDLLIINILISPIVSNISDKFPTDPFIASEVISNNPGLFREVSIMMFFSSLIALLYFAIMEYKLGQSVGKMILKIYVVKIPAMTDKKKKSITFKDSKITFFNAIVRSLFVFPFFPFFILWILDPINIILNKNGIRLSERLSKTMTVEPMAMKFH